MESARLKYEHNGKVYEENIWWDHVPEWPIHVAKGRGPGLYRLVEIDLGNGFIVRPYDEEPFPFIRLKLPQRYLRIQVGDRFCELRLYDGELEVIVVIGGGGPGCYVPFEGSVADGRGQQMLYRRRLDRD